MPIIVQTDKAKEYWFEHQDLIQVVDQDNIVCSVPALDLMEDELIYFSPNRIEQITHVEIRSK